MPEEQPGNLTVRQQVPAGTQRCGLVQHSGGFYTDLVGKTVALSLQQSESAKEGGDGFSWLEQNMQNA